jgi:hypothetical protein
VGGACVELEVFSRLRGEETTRAVVIRPWGKMRSKRSSSLAIVVKPIQSLRKLKSVELDTVALPGMARVSQLLVILLSNRTVSARGYRYVKIEEHLSTKTPECSRWPTVNS